MYTYPLWLISVFIFFTFAHPSTSHGTAAFVVRTPHEIVVAADSRSVDGAGNITSDRVCKIRPFGSAYIVINGMLDYQPTGYDVLSISKEAGEQQGLLENNTATFEMLVKRPLEQALTRMKRDEPEAFQQNAIQMAPLGVNFVAVEKEELVLYSHRFKVNLPLDHKVTIFSEQHKCPSDCPLTNKRAAVLVGDNELTKRFAKEHHNYYAESNLVEVARKFIQMHIDAPVVNVGLPIDILRITRDRAEWIQRKSECEDKKDSTTSDSKQQGG